MTQADDGVEVVHWYTLARKFPQLIGRTPDGARIWGGPYTYTQAIGGALVLVAGAKTTSLWGGFGVIGNAVVLLGGAYLTTWVLGRIPVGSRSPLSVGAGALRALSAPPAGRYAGRPLRIRRPHLVTTRIATAPAAARAASTRPIPARGPQQGRPQVAPAACRTSRSAPADPPPPLAAPSALTGVQRLLAAAGNPTET